MLMRKNGGQVQVPQELMKLLGQAKPKGCLAMDMPGSERKVQYCKEKYCIGTWNIRSMNLGRLDLVKQEMARINIDIPGISELKLTGMGKFNSGDYHIYCCGQESHTRNGVCLLYTSPSPRD